MFIWEQVVRPYLAYIYIQGEIQLGYEEELFEGLKGVHQEREAV